jgi:hypothetical protein
MFLLSIYFIFSRFANSPPPERLAPLFSTASMKSLAIDPPLNSSLASRYAFLNTSQRSLSFSFLPPGLG